MYVSNVEVFLEGIEGWIKYILLMKVQEGDVKDESLLDGMRVVRMGEIVGVVGMLCGMEVGWIMGQVVCVNGGMVMFYQGDIYIQSLWFVYLRDDIGIIRDKVGCY